MSHIKHEHNHEYLLNDETIARNEKKTLFVVILTSVMMVVEILAGYLTGSMALLADGWHMLSHAGALGISFLAYKLAKSEAISQHFSFGTGKFIPLGGYTSAIALGIIALLMAYHSIERILNPISIHFTEAIVVAVVGLIVNIISAAVLFDKGHHHDHGVHDHNLKSAYVHVIADALTSIFAIIALVMGSFFGVFWLDPVMGIVGSIVILRWAYSLCKETAWELLDGHSKHIDRNEVRSHIEDEGVEVSDLHIWRVAPNAHACEVVLFTDRKMGTEHYRNLIAQKFKFEHLVVEERECVH